jgi:hypothetical protein
MGGVRALLEHSGNSEETHPPEQWYIGNQNASVSSGVVGAAAILSG